MAGYLGSVPVPQATQHRETFTATAGQTTFNTAGYTPLFVDVYLNGVHLSPADITATNGSDVVLAECVVNDIVDIVSYTPFEVANQTFTGTTTMTDVVAATLDISGNIDIDGTTNLDVVDIDGAVDMASTLGVAGVVTANAGVVVDNITIDGSEIDLSSGNLTIDVAGYIIIDSDDGNIYLNDGGSGYGQISGASQNLTFKSSTSDKDMIFQGNDGGSAITALTLDMSQAGRATFNEGIVAGTSTAGAFGLTLNTASGDNMTLSVADTGSAGAALGTISVSDGSLTLDVAGDINLDADGGDINLKDGGTAYAHLSNSSSDFFITNPTSDKDIHFRGNDGGSFISALTLDMSQAGSATFNSAIKSIGPNVSHIGAAGVVIGQDDSATSQIRCYGTNDSTLGTLKIESTTSAGSTTKTLLTMAEGSADFNPSALNMDFRVRSDGNDNMLFVDGGNNYVGVGTSAPSSDLNVHNPTTTCALIVSGENNANRKAVLEYNATDGPIVRGGSSGITSLKFAVDNATLAGKFDSNADFYTNDGTVHSLSDIRVKTDVEDLTDGLDIVRQLKPRTFRYTEDSEFYNEKTKDEIKHGFVANEVETVAPQYTDIGKGRIGGEEVNDLRSLSTTKMIPMLVKAIQELSAKNDALESRLETLEG